MKLRKFSRYMKMKIFFTLILASLWSVNLQAQKILTLKECYDLANASNALAGEKNAYVEISSLKDNNLSKGWLPTLDANGSFIYNSSVIDLSSVLGSLPVPGIANAIKPLPNEQYKITIDINQVIYDGGAIKGARNLEKANLKVNEKQTETDLYKLREQINGYYFNLMLLARQKELLDNYHELIMKKIEAMESAVANGVILKSDIDVLTSEKINLEQQLSENEIRKNALLKVLSDITGKEIDASTQFVVPSVSAELTDEISRPELQLFDVKKEQLAAGLEAIDSKRMPVAFGFATFGYGNPPGSNFFKDEFAPYYIVGAGVKWNIFDWNKVKNEKHIIALQQDIIEKRKNDLTDNLKRLLESKNAEIQSYIALTESDSELITLRKRITATAESQYKNGTITATDYLNELNSERQAILNYEIHKLNLALARVEYLNISGKEIE
jgi:outer membrane protein TolC